MMNERPHTRDIKDRILEMLRLKDLAYALIYFWAWWNKMWN